MAERSTSRRWTGCLAILLLLSLAVNAIVCGVSLFSGSDDADVAVESHLYGPKSARDKVAVIRAQGALVEGLDGHILRQIQSAARDDKVKAVVLRIDSPGGTIGASEDIHRELKRLRQGGHPRYPDAQAKPIVASMGSIAASGGYYIAMPAERVFAEKTTITGSIGVYASLPNVSELANKNGVKMELIKAGGIKGSGSPFHAMTPQERQPWQEMVDQAYDQFLDVVASGRPKLSKEKLRNAVVTRKVVEIHDDKGNPVLGPDQKPKTIEVTRNLADGGTYTAAEALQYDLIDEIGLLEDAVAAAAKSAGLSTYRVVEYQRPPSLLDALIGIKSTTRHPLDELSGAFAPRVWYMVPHAEISGRLTK